MLTNKKGELQEPLVYLWLLFILFKTGSIPPAGLGFWPLTNERNASTGQVSVW